MLLFPLILVKHEGIKTKKSSNSGSNLILPRVLPNFLEEVGYKLTFETHFIVRYTI